MPFDVLLVDDHKIMRDGIKAILGRDADFRVVGEAETGTDAVQFVKRLRPDLVLLDIGLPGLNGVETTAEILRHQPDCKLPAKNQRVYSNREQYRKTCHPKLEQRQQKCQHLQFDQPAPNRQHRSPNAT